MDFKTKEIGPEQHVQIQLKNLFKESALNQKELAAMSGLSESVISRWLTGHRKINLENVEKIAAAMNARIVVIPEKRDENTDA